MDAISRTPKFLHDFAYTAYVCSVCPDIVQDAKRRIKGNGAVRIEIENCVQRLLCHDVGRSIDGTINIKTDQFWDELKHFQNRTGMFNRQTWFNSLDCIEGNSAKWHDKYSHHHAPVFGYIACQVTSKITGSGGAERGWADTKMIKTGKCSHLSSDNRAEHEKSNCLSKDACWGDEDEPFELGLLKWGVDVEQLKKLLKWIRSEGWHAMAEPPDYVGDGDDDDTLEPLAITDED
eukprot:CCRYP_009141-RA/>CCRYP_009141-RA protein AED:0.28 eAED:0.28 QI:0/0/0/1/0.33/0.25/4/0/233